MPGFVLPTVVRLMQQRSMRSAAAKPCARTAPTAAIVRGQYLYPKIALLSGSDAVVADVPR